jgi:adenine-specific DNA glycosylase
MKHIFTHFQLNIRPILIVIHDHQYLTSIADSNQSIWYKLDDELSFGVPTPVLKLINQIKQLKLNK